MLAPLTEALPFNSITTSNVTTGTTPAIREGGPTPTENGEATAPQGGTTTENPPTPTSTEMRDSTITHTTTALPGLRDASRLDLVGARYFSIIEGFSPPDAPEIRLIPGHTPSDSDLITANAYLNPSSAPLLFARRREAAVQNTANATAGAYRPVASIDDPASYLTACPMAARRDSPTTAAPSAEGAHVTVDGSALLELHRQHMHSADRPCTDTCYIHSLALHATGHIIPFTEQPPLTRSPAPPTPNPHGPPSARGGEEDDIESAVEKLTSLGVVHASPSGEEDIFISKVAIAYKHAIPLTPQEEARCISSPSTNTYADIAKVYAVRFMLVLTTALAALSNSITDTPDSVYCNIFWDCMGTVFTQHSPRFVFDGRALNKFISPWPITYPRLSDLFTSITPGSWAAKVDLVKGYYAITMHPSMLKYLHFWHKGVLYHFSRLPMGLACSAAVFCWLTAEINAWLRAAGSTASIVFVDDFLICANTKEEAQAALDLLISLINSIGLKHSIEKSSREPVQLLDMLGVTVNTNSPSVSVPASSFIKFFTLAIIVNACATQQLPVPLKILSRLAGCVNWAEIVYKHLAPFTQPLAAFQSRGERGRGTARWWRGLFRWDKSPADTTRITTAIKHVMLLQNPSIPTRILPFNASTARHHIFISSDASGPKRTTCVSWGQSAIHCTVDADCGWDVPLLEFLAVALVAILWGKHLKGAFIHHALDALGVTYWGNAGRARREDALLMLKIAARCHLENDIQDSYHWLRRCFNHDNDIGAQSSPENAAALHFKDLYHLDLHGTAAVCLPGLLCSTGQKHILDHINI